MTREAWRPKPINLTARAAYVTPGNPAITRPEDAVANCYPGLELDIRNLDRRFFPGLVFEFVARGDTGDAYSEPTRYGARLAYVDKAEDPELADDLLTAVKHNASALGEGEWYIEWMEQGGRRLSMQEDRDGQRLPMDGLFVWRLVRSLTPDPVTICLHRRDVAAPDIILAGPRRRFTDPLTGVISLAYQPGEMLQSLCSPWQHDFRDCYCHYWASNHPDIAFGEIAPGEPTLPDGRPADPKRTLARLDWLRSERSPALSAFAADSFPGNRPFQFDHFEINEGWRRLNVVVNNVEVGESYAAPKVDLAEPYAGPEELAEALRSRLAPLEIALAYEYLYARLSLLTEAEALKRGGAPAADAVVYARHFLLLTAASEMQHLRWANELLWRLHQEKLVGGTYAPVLLPAHSIPRPPRRFEMRRLTMQTLKDFVEVEAPSGFLDGEYAHVIATLRGDRRYPEQMQQLAERIANDGMDHERHFLDMQAVLSRLPGETAYLRNLTRADPADPKVANAMARFRAIRDELGAAFLSGAAADLPAMGVSLRLARDKMDALLAETDALALEGVGFPFDAP